MQKLYYLWSIGIFFVYLSAFAQDESILVTVGVPIVHSNVFPSPEAYPENVRLITLYIPAAAAQNPTQRFPSIYYLPGLGGTNESFTLGNQILLDNLVATDEAVPMIVIHVDPSMPIGPFPPTGLFYYQGTWYVNSALNGDFETFVLQDMIPFVDANFPTIANGAFRGVAGQSMGGYGALYLGIRHPDVFCGFGAESPTAFWAIVTQEELVAPPGIPFPGNQMFTINSLLLPEIPTEGPQAGQITPDNGPFTFSVFSYAGAFSPNLGKPPYFVDLPFAVDKNNFPLFAHGAFTIADPLTGEHSTSDVSFTPIETVIQQWRDKDPFSFVHEYFSSVALQSIYIDGGNIELIDSAGSRLFSDQLVDVLIDHTYILYNGDHTTCLTSELCARNQTIFQMFSATFANAGLVPDQIRTKIVGTTTIILSENAQMNIFDNAIVGIETSPTQNITNTNVSLIITDNAQLNIGTATQQGGVLQIGNRFSKSAIQGDPILLDHEVSGQIILNGPNARLEIGQAGVLGLGAGIDGKEVTALNNASSLTLVSVKNLALILRQGTLAASSVITGQDPQAGLLLLGLSDRYMFSVNPAVSTILGGGNIVTINDSFRRQPVVVTTAGFDPPGGILNNLDTNPDATDYFYQLPISSTLYYTNVTNIGTLVSSLLMPSKNAFYPTPFSLTTASYSDATDFLSMNQNADFFSLNDKKGALGSNINLTFNYANPDQTISIIRIPQNQIPIGSDQTNLNLSAIAQQFGTLDIIVNDVDGSPELIRVDTPVPA
ncbi:MAG TPA: alpha/beta hydrolase-fold protein [Candidatus Bathyarchaeia archaeon]|nr:alpha/beta hydrolase-fold protein [Candidatus Bathyarchaeia archaeon]